MGVRVCASGWAVALALVLGFTAAAAPAQQTVDTIVTHGKILTVDADFKVDAARLMIYRSRYADKW